MENNERKEDQPVSSVTCRNRQRSSRRIEERKEHYPSYRWETVQYHRMHTERYRWIHTRRKEIKFLPSLMEVFIRYTAGILTKKEMFCYIVGERRASTWRQTCSTNYIGQFNMNSSQYRNHSIFFYMLLFQCVCIALFRSILNHRQTDKTAYWKRRESVSGFCLKGSDQNVSNN